jgi:uncharacterized GH25 family protein
METMKQKGHTVSVILGFHHPTGGEKRQLRFNSPPGNTSNPSSQQMGNRKTKQYLHRKRKKSIQGLNHGTKYDYQFNKKIAGKKLFLELAPSYYNQYLHDVA